MTPLTYEELVRRFYASCAECVELTSRCAGFALPPSCRALLRAEQVRRVSAGQNRLQERRLHLPGLLERGLSIDEAAYLLWHPRAGAPLWINVYPSWASADVTYIFVMLKAERTIAPGVDLDLRSAISPHEPFRVRGPALDANGNAKRDLRTKPADPTRPF